MNFAETSSKMTSNPFENRVSSGPWATAAATGTPNFCWYRMFIAIAPASAGTASEMNESAYRNMIVGPNGMGEPTTPARLKYSPMLVSCAQTSATITQLHDAFDSSSAIVSSTDVGQRRDQRVGGEQRERGHGDAAPRHPL